MCLTVEIHLGGSDVVLVVVSGYMKMALLMIPFEAVVI